MVNDERQFIPEISHHRTDRLPSFGQGQAGASVPDGVLGKQFRHHIIIVARLLPAAVAGIAIPPLEINYFLVILNPAYPFFKRFIHQYNVYLNDSSQNLWVWKKDIFSRQDAKNAKKNIINNNTAQSTYHLMRYTGTVPMNSDFRRNKPGPNFVFLHALSAYLASWREYHLMHCKKHEF